MKTSPAQFDLMVTFMEQHGDLSKPSSNARGRMEALKSWEELTSLLNSDGGGDSKTSEKWKKVWSDYKNNTKKKAARLHKAISGTGGGPAVHINLTDLEQRVLNLIGVQAATGLAVPEVGLPQQGHSIHERVPPPHSPLPPLHPPQTLNYSEPWNTPGENIQASSPIELEIPPLTAPQERPGISPVRIAVQKMQTVTPTLSPSHLHAALPALTGQTPRRSRQRRSRGSPRRRPVRPSHTEQAAEQFLRSDQEWRNFQIMQHRDCMDMRREQNAVRRLEVEVQREWQKIGMRALDILEKLVNN